MDTLTLAGIFGPLYLAVGAGIFLNEKYYAKITTDFCKNGALMYVTGVILLLFGVYLINAHGNKWTLDADGLVTLIIWGMTLKGTIMVVAPESMIAMIKKCPLHQAKVGATLALIIGGYLSYLMYLA